MLYSVNERKRLSEELINDLYIDLRKKILKWSALTKQTSQARMGYIGQHLVSIVIGYEGSKSGARGYDIIISNSENKIEYGEIKTCYRVDQLGHCLNCGASVSPIEKLCPYCNSDNIERKDDSKWLLTIRNEEELSEMINPLKYYFVLFEFENIKDSNNKNIIASIWEVNPKTSGFYLCVLDYYFNIRACSKTKAPFNLWPYQLKFYLMSPQLIYRAIIGENNVKTIKFPESSETLNFEKKLPSLEEFSSAKVLNKDSLKNIFLTLKEMNKIEIPFDYNKINDKKTLLKKLEELRNCYPEQIKDDFLLDILAKNIYLPKLLLKFDNEIPENYKKLINASKIK